MMGVYFYDGGILFDSGKIAFHEDCCCDGDLEICEYCESGNAPAQMEVTVAGITNGACANCTTLNGVHICDNYIFGNWCGWCKTGSPDVCAYVPTTLFGIIVRILYVGGDYQLTVRVELGGTDAYSPCKYMASHWFYKNSYGASKPDCDLFDAVEVLYDSAYGSPTSYCLTPPSSVLVSTI